VYLLCQKTKELIVFPKKRRKNMTKEQKQMWEGKYLPPTSDIVFQALFGRQGSEEITKDFLEHILKIQIDSIDLSKTKILERNKVKDKQSILDVRAEINGEEKCNIEMQMVNQDALIERLLFYWGRLFQEPMKKGEDYTKLKKTISILIANFRVKGLETLGYHTKWKIIEEKDRIVILTDAFEIHIIELPKIQGKEEEQDGLLDWLFFLKNPESERTKKGMEENEKIQDAEKELEKLKDDEWLADVELHQLLAEWDKKAIESMAKREGREAGLAEGRKAGLKAGLKEGLKEGKQEEKRETARKLLEMKMPLADIMKVTELTEEEIKQIQEENKN